MNKHDLDNWKKCCRSFKMDWHLGAYDEIIKKALIGFMIVWIGIGIYLFN